MKGLVERLLQRNYKRHAIGQQTAQWTTMLMMLTVILTGATVIAYLTGVIPGSTLTTGGQAVNPAAGCINNYLAPSGFTCTQLPLNWVVSDLLAGSPVASVTIKAYNPVTLAPEDAPGGTTSSAGALASVSNWNSGKSFTCKVSATNYVTSFFPCTVPANPSGNTALTTITMPLPIVKLGTYSVTATVAGVSGWSSSFSTYNFGAQSTTSVAVVWTIQETVNNAGYVSSIDRYTAGTTAANFLVLELKSASSPKTSVSNCQYGSTINNVQYCQYILPDGFTSINGGYTQSSLQSAITAYFPTGSDGRFVTSALPNDKQQTTAGGVTCTGSASKQFATGSPVGGTVTCSTTFNKGSLSSATESWTMTLYRNADPVWYDGTGGGTAYGAYGGDQASLTLDPSWSTVKLYA